MRLLIAEDEEDMREALCYGLRKRGYAVDEAADGGEAVELCEVNEYDLLILDLNLPAWTGWRRCAASGSRSGRQRC